MQGFINKAFLLSKLLFDNHIKKEEKSFNVYECQTHFLSFILSTFILDQQVRSHVFFSLFYNLTAIVLIRLIIAYRNNHIYPCEL